MVSADMAYALLVETKGQFRYFRELRGGRVMTAWSLAGATLFLDEGEAGDWRAELEAKKRFARVVVVRTVLP